jgi:tRNA pseudouridine32 synthase/23S rRNA pseudouridine746 synthase
MRAVSCIGASSSFPGRFNPARVSIRDRCDMVHPSLASRMGAIVYRDDRLIVFDKPSGLLSVPGRGPDLQDCLSARAQGPAPGALVVHRLDRDTSGLMVMALDPGAQRELSRQFAARAVEKRYIAMVFGCPVEDQGVIDLPMRKDFDRPPRHKIDLAHGRPAQTHWRAIERSGDRSRWEVRPLTGRSHQIRLHLATLGHGILGDNLYASDEARRMAPRLLLHAEYLSLSHPDDGRRMEWTAACPF